MELEPKSLNIPLQKRSWFQTGIVAGSMLMGWLWHRPTELHHVLVSCLLGGAGVWFFLASPIILKLGSHKAPLVRGITFVAAVTGLVFFMSEVVPCVHKLVK